MLLLFALFKFDSRCVEPPGLETLESEGDRLRESAPSETELRRNPPPVCPKINGTLYISECETGDRVDPKYCTLLYVDEGTFIIIQIPIPLFYSYFFQISQLIWYCAEIALDEVRNY